MDRLEPVYKLVDKNALLVGEQRCHAGAFNLYRLVEKNDDDQRKTDGDQQVACPNTNFMANVMLAVLAGR